MKRSGTIIAWYLAHKAELLKQYEGKYLVISASGLLYVAATEDEGVIWRAERNLEDETIVHLCSVEEEIAHAPTAVFYEQDI